MGRAVSAEKSLEVAAREQFDFHARRSLSELKSVANNRSKRDLSQLRSWTEAHITRLTVEPRRSLRLPPSPAPMGPQPSTTLADSFMLVTTQPSSAVWAS